MNDLREYVAYYLDLLHQGDAECAFFGLIEAGPEVLPHLIEAYGRDENRAVRAELVRCIWEHRQPEVIGFLAQLLTEPEESVWKEALDGLVAIGGGDVIRALLQEARTTLAGTSNNGNTAVEWIDEAVDQLQADPYAS